MSYICLWTKKQLTVDSPPPCDSWKMHKWLMWLPVTRPDADTPNSHSLTHQWLVNVPHWSARIKCLLIWLDQTLVKPRGLCSPLRSANFGIRNNPSMMFPEYLLAAKKTFPVQLSDHATCLPPYTHSSQPCLFLPIKREAFSAWLLMRQRLRDLTVRALPLLH